MQVTPLLPCQDQHHLRVFAVRCPSGSEDRRWPRVGTRWHEEKSPIIASALQGGNPESLRLNRLPGVQATEETGDLPKTPGISAPTTLAIKLPCQQAWSCPDLTQVRPWSPGGGLPPHPHLLLLRTLIRRT